jgi:hypothetical protein
LSDHGTVEPNELLETCLDRLTMYTGVDVEDTDLLWYHGRLSGTDRAGQMLITAR